MTYIRVTEDKIEELIKNVLGFGQYIDRGLTGRAYRTPTSETPIPERAEFGLWDIAEAAEVLDDDTILEAAIEGVRRYLEENKEEISVKLNTAAEIAKQELLDVNLSWVVKDGHAEAWSYRGHAQEEADRIGGIVQEYPTNPVEAMKGGRS